MFHYYWLSIILVGCVGRNGSGRVAAAGGGGAGVMVRGFSARHDPSYTQFQPVLSDPSGVFSLGFLRVNSTLLHLAILHLPSSFPLWLPDIPPPLPLWSAPASLSFHGTLLLTDPTTSAVLWSAGAAGDRAVLLNSSNLQIQSTSTSSSSVLWQSFDFPSDTMVQNQNFTSTAALVASNRRFAMRLGASYLALFAESGAGSAMYWKHTAMEAKAQIAAGGGPIYARVDPGGFLGMYQKEDPPADVLPFDTFNRGVGGLRRMTLESDGNLRAYYWNTSAWILEYTAITDPCQLPATCGSYSICAGSAEGPAQCTPLANGAEAPAAAGGLCGGLEWMAVRRRGVELANKELVGLRRVGSWEECEGVCERNCSCWGAVYSNSSGSCYDMDYPAQLLVEGDGTKLAYFKLSMHHPPTTGSKPRAANGAKVALLSLGLLLAAAAAGVAAAYNYRIWVRRRLDARQAKEELAPGPYKNLASSSFNSIELSTLDSFRK